VINEQDRCTSVKLCGCCSASLLSLLQLATDEAREENPSFRSFYLRWESVKLNKNHRCKTCKTQKNEKNQNYGYGKPFCIHCLHYIQTLSSNGFDAKVYQLNFEKIEPEKLNIQSEQTKKFKITKKNFLQNDGKFSKNASSVGAFSDITSKANLQNTLTPLPNSKKTTRKRKFNSTKLTIDVESLQPDLTPRRMSTLCKPKTPTQKPTSDQPPPAKIRRNDISAESLVQHLKTLLKHPNKDHRNSALTVITTHPNASYYTMKHQFGISHSKAKSFIDGTRCDREEFSRDDLAAVAFWEAESHPVTTVSKGNLSNLSIKPGDLEYEFQLRLHGHRWASQPKKPLHQIDQSRTLDEFSSLPSK